MRKAIRIDSHTRQYGEGIAGEVGGNSEREKKSLEEL